MLETRNDDLPASAVPWSVHGALDHPRGDQSVGAQAGDEGLGARVAERGTVAHPLAAPGAAAQPGHVGLGAALVDEDQPVRLLPHARPGVPGPMLPLGADVRPVALRGFERLFLYVISALVSTREIEDG